MARGGSSSIDVQERASARVPGLVELWRNLTRDPRVVRARADRDLRALLRHAYEHVPFYRELWRAAGFDPREWSGRRDLAAIPAVDKDMLVEAGQAVLDRRTPPERLTTMATSGTSGRAIRVHRTAVEMRVMRRSVIRPLFAEGARPWQRFVTVASTWLKERKGVFLGRFSRTRHLEALASLDEQIDVVRSFRPVGIVGQTGGIYLLARELLRRGMFVPLRHLMPTGATLMPAMRRTMREAFGIEPGDLYGSIELGTISWRCRRGHYHIDADRVIVEIVDDCGRPLPPGRTGQVVCTLLHTWSMPFIRYRLLDVAALSSGTCDCGCRFPLMEPVQGRVNDFLPTPRGDLVSPHFFFHLFDAAGTNPVREWRVVQERIDELLYEYVPEDDFDPAALACGLDLVRQRFGPGCRVRSRAVRALPVHPSGKRTCIVSRLRPDGAAPGRAWIGGEDAPVGGGRPVAGRLTRRGPGGARAPEGTGGGPPC